MQQHVSVQDSACSSYLPGQPTTAQHAQLRRMAYNASSVEELQGFWGFLILAIISHNVADL